MATWDFIQKQILLGDASTGKSSLLVRLTDDRFLLHSEPTIGVEFGSRIVPILEGIHAGKHVKLQIWDTAGQESFRSITRSYYRGAGGALLVFDLSDRNTFLSCESWLADLKNWGEEDLCILLVGNKGDLIQPGAEVKNEAGVTLSEEARVWAREQGLEDYVETSAKTGAGVEEAFNTLTRKVHDKHQRELAARKGAKSGSASSLPSLSLGGANGAAGKCC